MITEIYAKSNREIAGDIGRRFQQYRKRMGLTQKQVAEKSGLSVFTISSFEKGTGTGLSLSAFIALMRSIEQLELLETLLPELPESPKAIYERQLKRKRG